MAFITKQDFTSHIYEEGMNKISRNDESKVETALQVGMQVAARSLGRYNTAEIYASTGADQMKYAELITYIKDIAKWHFIAVANVQVDFEIAEMRYKSALVELKAIRTGETIPGWPLPEPIAGTTEGRSGGRPKFNYE